MPQERNVSVLLQPEPEGGFTVFVPGLSGVVAYGETEVDALEMAKEVTVLSLEVREEQGDELPTDAKPNATRSQATVAFGLSNESGVGVIWSLFTVVA